MLVSFIINENQSSLIKYKLNRLRTITFVDKKHFKKMASASSHDGVTGTDWLSLIITKIPDEQYENKKTVSMNLDLKEKKGALRAGKGMQRALRVSQHTHCLEGFQLQLWEETNGLPQWRKRKEMHSTWLCRILEKREAHRQHVVGLYF